MKKFSIISSFLLSISLCADYKDFRKAFYALDKEKLNKIVGYDLDLQLWEDNRERVVHAIPSIYSHGFGASPNTMNEWIRVAGPDKIPGDVITYRLPDATDDKTIDFSQASFGQNLDIIATIIVLNAVKACTPTWNLIGQSRGAAVSCNTLATLMKNEDCSYGILKQCDITQEDRKSLIHGTKTLTSIVPMTTMHEGIKAKIKQRLGLKSANWMVNACIIGATYLLDTVFIPLYSRGNYFSWGEQALSSIEYLPPHIKFLVHYQKNDTDVGNDNDKIFTQKLIEHLGQDNVWVVLGHDDGTIIDDETWSCIEQARSKGALTRLGSRVVRAHNADPFTLLKKGVISAFYKKHGGSFVNDQNHLEQGNCILNKSQIGLEDIEKHFENYLQS